MSNRIIQSRLLAWRPLLAMATLGLSACESSTAVGTSTQIRMAAPAVVGQSTEAAGGLSIVGTNGTLVITDVKMIVNEFELRRADIVDCDDSSGSGSCGSFESSYFIADVPLGAGSVTVANDRIPAGTYVEMEFEIEDLEVDIGDAEDVAASTRINALLTELRATYANWPAGASMRIQGTFTPTGGVAQSFVAYFDAEVEIERLFPAPLVINETTTGLTIDLRLDLWFKNGDGSVRNLALSNCSTSCPLIDFDVEIQEGFDVEFDS